MREDPFKLLVVSWSSGDQWEACSTAPGSIKAQVSLLGVEHFAQSALKRTRNRDPEAPLTGMDRTLPDGEFSGYPLPDLHTLHACAKSISLRKCLEVGLGRVVVLLPGLVSLALPFLLSPARNLEEALPRTQ